MLVGFFFFVLRLVAKKMRENNKNKKQKPVLENKNRNALKHKGEREREREREGELRSCEMRECGRMVYIEQGWW